MNSYTGASLTAAGVVFDIDDFRDPKLDQLTPVQVTKDGRVFGHLAGWKTNHIGYADRDVKPPRSKADYRYFHQSVVPTTDGDLPVGHLTLGTGHAGRGDAMAAAAHYDNTGSQAASVRAGEDRHGIWIAGRVLPGTDDVQRQTLRRSSLSGDWRKIDGNLELVAALAVNVPGFPIPRTEQLVASAGSGDVDMLVAAGIVQNGPLTPAGIEQMVAAAAERAQKSYENRLRRQTLTAAGQQQVDLIKSDARARRRESLAASGRQQISDMRRDEINRQFTQIVAAGVVDDAAGHMPSALHKYWTAGEGLARWASTPTPYRSLVTALTAEVEGMSPDQIKGLAANLYHDVFGTWPGKQGKGGESLAASGRPPSRERARRMLATPKMQRLLAAAPIPGAPVEAVEELPTDQAAAPVHTGGMIALLPAEAAELAVDGGDPVDELHMTLAYLGPDLTDRSPEWISDVQLSVTRAFENVGPIAATLNGRAVLNENSDEREACAVWLVDSKGAEDVRQSILAALGDRVPPSDFGSFLAHLTAGYGVDVAALTSGQQITFNRVRIAIAGDYTDVPLGGDTADDSIVGELESAAGPRRAQTQEGADKYGVSIGDVIGQGIDDAAANANATVDAAQKDVANVARAIGEAIFGKPKPLPADQGDATEIPATSPIGVEPARAADAPATPDDEEFAESEPAADEVVPVDDLAAEPAAKTEPAPEVVDELVDPTEIGDAPFPRKDVGAGTDHPMEEDEAPDNGARGGTLTDYRDGVAYYDDGSQTDGTEWSETDGDAAPTEIVEPVVDESEIDATDPAANPEGVADEAAPVAGEPITATVVETEVPTRVDAGAGDDHPMEEDEIPETGADGGAIVDYSDGTAIYDDGTVTDGTDWSRAPVLPEMGYDGGTMLEDQAPLAGAYGGDLTEYAEGVAYYDDGSQTDGTEWTTTVEAPVVDETVAI